MIGNLCRYAIIMLLACTLVHAEEIQAHSTISRVQVYLQGAQVYHSTQLELPPGTHEIIFDSIATSFNNSSLRTALNGEASLVAISQRLHHTIPPGAQPTPNVTRLLDSIADLQFAIRDKRAEQAALEEEQKLILSQVSAVGKSEELIEIAILQKTSDFIGRRLRSIKKGINLLNREIQKSDKRIAALQDTITMLQANKPRQQVVVTVSADKMATVDVEVSYLIDQAGWAPLYDIRVPAIGEKMQLQYKALVWQKSGIDWRDVQVSVSTRNPLESSDFPVLQPWLIEPIDPGAIRSKSQLAVEHAARGLYGNIVGAHGATEDEVSRSGLAESVQMLVEFHPDQPYSIPANGKAHMLSLQTDEIQPLYEYFAVPKLDADAFLLARVTQWSQYNLLPGKVNIYFRNSFVGTSSLQPSSVSDTLSISLGRDKNVSIKRRIRSDYTSSTFLSSDVERSFAYQISARNPYDRPILLTIEEPVPIALNDEVQVDILDRDEGVFHELKGSLRWRMAMSPGQSSEKNIRYIITHSSSKQIPGL